MSDRATAVRALTKWANANRDDDVVRFNSVVDEDGVLIRYSRWEGIVAQFLVPSRYGGHYDTVTLHYTELSADAIESLQAAVKRGFRDE